jgi:hypothetical protein
MRKTIYTESAHTAETIGNINGVSGLTEGRFSDPPARLLGAHRATAQISPPHHAPLMTPADRLSSANGHARPAP